jgi:tetratricopeptide (TPR) repeat protein
MTKQRLILRIYFANIICFLFFACSQPIVLKFNPDWSSKPVQQMGYLSGTCSCFDPDRIFLDNSLPFAQSVKKVFSRVCTASDKKEERFPSLFITNGQELSACVLATGEIQISIGTLEFLYNKDIPIQVSEARLAFILAHEMAHSSHHDFKKNTFMNDIVYKKKLEKIELEADRYGILFATFAEFKPEYIIDYNGINFIQQWESINKQDNSSTLYSHPSPYTRKNHLQTIADETLKALDLFHAAIKLYLIGNYSDALTCLKHFSMYFPSREVYSNMGTCYLQLFLQQSQSPLDNFVLPAIMDSESSADLFSSNSRSHNKALEYALKNFHKAIKRDPYYLISRINMSTTLLLMEDYQKANALLEQMLKRYKNPHIYNNYSILLWAQNHHQCSNQIIDMMKKASSMNCAYCQNLEYLLPDDLDSLPDQCIKTSNQTAPALPDFIATAISQQTIEKMLAQGPYNEFKLKKKELAFYAYRNFNLLTVNEIPAYIELHVPDDQFSAFQINYDDKQLIPVSSPAVYISYHREDIVLKVLDNRIDSILYKTGDIDNNQVYSYKR